MQALERIGDYADELTAIRRDLHAHPELGFEEVRTAGVVADKLRGWGIEVATGIGRTGVVGVIEGNRPGRRIGLRADMDALPIHEQTNLPLCLEDAGRDACLRPRRARGDPARARRATWPRRAISPGRRC